MKKFFGRTIRQNIPFILILTALIGLTASLVLTLEEVAIYKDPNHRLSCSINPVIACGPVMKSDEAHTFGISNPYIGLVAFSVVGCVGVTMLAGAKMKKWYWQAFQAGTAFGMLFIIWLIYGSVYKIGALCLYCMATWIAVSIMFWYLLQWNLEMGHIKLADKYKKFIRRYHGEILLTWFILITGIILNHFWYYFKTVL